MVVGGGGRTEKNGKALFTQIFFSIHTENRKLNVMLIIVMITHHGYREIFIPIMFWVGNNEKRIRTWWVGSSLVFFWCAVLYRLQIQGIHLNGGKLQWESFNGTRSKCKLLLRSS